MPRQFAITWDYRCPYARVAHDHVIAGLRAGAAWDVDFLPFSLGQAHVEPGEPDVWEHPDRDSGLLALQVAVAVRDHAPDSFLDLHHALFDYRHHRGGDLRDRDALGGFVTEAGADAAAVFDRVDDGSALATIKEEHTRVHRTHEVWGVPTFVMGDAAVFVRLLDRADGDGRLATETVNRVLDQIEWPILNEFKHTSIPR